MEELCGFLNGFAVVASAMGEILWSFAKLGARIFYLLQIIFTINDFPNGYVIFGRSFNYRIDPLLLEWTLDIEI